MNSAAEWIASIPDQLTARDALVFIEQALADARTATDEVRARFSGTVPPPPWPQSPELVQAIAAMEGGRTLLQRAIELGHTNPQPKSGAIGVRLQNGGRLLYAEIAKMRKRAAELPTAKDIPDLAKHAALGLANTSIGGLLVLGGVLWLAYKFGDE